VTQSINRHFLGIISDDFKLLLQLKPQKDKLPLPQRNGEEERRKGLMTFLTRDGWQMNSSIFFTLPSFIFNCTMKMRWIFLTAASLWSLWHEVLHQTSINISIACPEEEILVKELLQGNISYRWSPLLKQ
jgi:hypothetical protein